MLVIVGRCLGSGFVIFGFWALDVSFSMVCKGPGFGVFICGWFRSHRNFGEESDVWRVREDVVSAIFGLRVWVYSLVHFARNSRTFWIFGCGVLASSRVRLWEGRCWGICEGCFRLL